MSIALIATNRDMQPVRDAILQIDPDLNVDIWPDIREYERVTFVVAWNQPEHLLSRFPNLKVVSSLGAGADHLVSDPSIPGNVDITRVVTPSLKTQMYDYIETWCYNFLRRTTVYFHQKQSKIWNVVPHSHKNDLRVGILGLGEIGRFVAGHLVQNGWIVSGFSKSMKEIPGVDAFAGKSRFETFLKQTHILVNLLPATSETYGLLDLGVFKRLKDPSFLIQTGRGTHLVDEDLLYAMDTEQVSEAVLDVFEQEPLPDSHTFWNRDSIFITPHVASITIPTELSEHVVDNYKRMISGLPLLNRVNRSQGY